MTAITGSIRRALVVGLAVAMMLPVGAAAAAAEPDRQVVVRGAQWFVAGAGSFSCGRSSDVQVMGDWDGNGSRTPGVFRAGTWFLRNGIGAVRAGTWHLRDHAAHGRADPRRRRQ